MGKIMGLAGMALYLLSCTGSADNNAGNTVITKWPDNKRSAISITYDDGTINQFTVARPIMNRYGLPGTFFIITGKVEGSVRGRFIGRPRSEIIRETASIGTNPDNFFERASLIGYTGLEGGAEYHARAGSLFESGKITQAYQLIDEAYQKVRTSHLQIKEEVFMDGRNPLDSTTWDDLKAYTTEGHEMASHTISHPRLAVLDEVNLLNELEQSKADIRKFLGDTYTFTAECPYGTEDERVMEYAHRIYPALRNRMPEPFLDEHNRWDDRNPGESDMEYVQWQRGPLREVGMEVMKSWVDTCMEHDNIWLVLVFHGVDGIGWEPRSGEELDAYFSYIHDRSEDLWVATFGDVTKYIRERKNTVISSMAEKDHMEIRLSPGLDPELYDVPLTLKTYVPSKWKKVVLTGGKGKKERTGLTIRKDSLGSYVIYAVSPSEGMIMLSD
jgi:peptidoglycan/xylan/chitin deacetylase (PgdA/CDA1 family)